MPIKSLPSAPNLEHLKYQAKDLLKALRERDTEAIALLREFHPSFTGRPEQETQSTRFTLSDAQLIVAREHGFDSWPKLKRHVESLGSAHGQTAPEAATGSSGGTRAERVAQFLEYACPDHHIRGGIAHIMARNAAMRLLKLDPGIARENLYTACVCGEVDVVERILSERPAAASEAYSAPGPDRSGSGSSDDVLRALGPKRWEPLLYVCFARVPIPAAQENAVAIAWALLARGANPNAYFMAGGSRYTPLVGVIGEGEENRLPHPQRDALTRLLLDHGAEPFDIQVIYNTHFQGKLLWFLRLIYDACVKAGRKQAWDDPDWSMLDMGGYGSGARFLFWVAIHHHDLALAEWMLQHGANPNAAPPRAQTLPQDSLYDYALRAGHPEMAALLARYGANRSNRTAAGEDIFLSACFRLDRVEAERLALEKPAYLSSPRALMEAAKADRVDVVRLLLDLGVSPNLPDPQEGNQHALHVAAYSDAAAVVELLIERGAEVDYRESNYGATALGFAIYGERWRAIEVLSRHTADVWMLTFLGKVERIRELLAANPALAKIASEDAETPLMRLPDDEEAALEMVRLFLHYGADPTLRNQRGQTAADLARRRHLDRAAVALANAEQVRGSSK